MARRCKGSGRLHVAALGEVVGGLIERGSLGLLLFGPEDPPHGFSRAGESENVICVGLAIRAVWGAEGVCWIISVQEKN
jgi:hypothetical protein